MSALALIPGAVWSHKTKSVLAIHRSCCLICYLQYLNAYVVFTCNEHCFQWRIVTEQIAEAQTYSAIQAGILLMTSKNWCEGHTLVVFRRPIEVSCDSSIRIRSRERYFNKLYITWIFEVTGFHGPKYSLYIFILRKHRPQTTIYWI